MTFTLLLLVTVLVLFDVFVVRLNMPYQKNFLFVYRRKIWHRYVFVTMLFVYAMFASLHDNRSLFVGVVLLYFVLAALVDALVVKERKRTVLRFANAFVFRMLLGALFAFSAWFFFVAMPFWLFLVCFVSMSALLIVLFDKFHFPFLKKRVRLVPYEHRNEDETIDHPILRNVYMVRFPHLNVGANAMLLGLFSKKHLLVSDALLARLSSLEILAIFVHELGHEKRNHMRTRLLFAMFCAVCSVATGYFFLSVGFGDGLLYYANAFLAFFLVWVVLRTLLFALLRRQEYAADAYAKASGYGRELVMALRRIEKAGKPTRFHPLYAKIHLTHPRGSDRMMRLLE